MNRKEIEENWIFLLTLPDGAGLGDALRAGVTSVTAPVLAFVRRGECRDLAMLERFAGKMREQGADILCYDRHQAQPGEKVLPSGQPLEGEHIFIHYLNQGCLHDLAGKLFERSLCRASLGVLDETSDALALPFFAAALHFHARRYVIVKDALLEQAISDGAPSLAQDDTATGPGRMMAISTLLQTFVSYCRRQGASPSLTSVCTEILEALLFREREACLRDAEPREFLNWGTELDGLRALIISHPLMRAVRDKEIASRWHRRWKAGLAAWARRVLSFGGNA